MVLKHAYERASKQRLEALKNAYKTIDQFAIGSCDPETFQQYEESRDYLIKHYGKVYKRAKRNMEK
jgi:hypothetical protein